MTDGAPLKIQEAYGREERFEVWNENWESLEVFLACATNWRYVGLGAPVGLDYPSVESVLRMRRVRAKGRIFAEVQDYERGALISFRERERATASLARSAR